MISISQKHARRIALHHQLLDVKPPTKNAKNLLNIIERLGYIQIDTISIVERAHHHILWTRMPKYEKQMLHDLLEKDKSIFEYWSHAAAFLPMRDYRFTFCRRDRYRKHYEGWAKKNRKIVNFVLDRIKAEGSLQSKDFEHTGKRKGDGWWDWKPAKNALQHLFHDGTLMIAARKGFQKVYDLTERVLPIDVDTTLPSEEEYNEHLIRSAISSYGFAAEKEITYLRSINRKSFKNKLNELLEARKLIELNIKGVEKEKYYTLPEYIKSYKDSKQIHILSPFDNLIIQRKRLKNIFDVDFYIEFYLPEPKRKFGYFCMPVLLGSEFIGKLDAKADRKSGKFEVINFFEEKNKMAKADPDEVKKKITDFAEFCGCEEVNWNGKI